MPILALLPLPERQLDDASVQLIQAATKRDAFRLKQKEESCRRRQLGRAFVARAIVCLCMIVGLHFLDLGQGHHALQRWLALGWIVECGLVAASMGSDRDDCNSNEPAQASSSSGSGSSDTAQAASPQLSFRPRRLPPQRLPSLKFARAAWGWCWWIWGFVLFASGALSQNYLLAVACGCCVAAWRATVSVLDAWDRQERSDMIMGAAASILLTPTARTGVRRVVPRRTVSLSRLDATYPAFFGLYPPGAWCPSPCRSPTLGSGVV